ncbi:glycosyltransferase [Membranihabitans maritimus]|uniref:glycosyltransferase n=1 Tax=Membranihabitans maritimus TaxID=2904244 RepID=UPI001F44CB0C|nr:glycosyltransferase [Membranihabitans maritimus]
MKKIIRIITTSQYPYDQRLRKVAIVLEDIGYEVHITDRSKGNYSGEINTIFKRGFLFYMEYNVRVFFISLFTPGETFYVADIDPMPAIILLSFFRKHQIILDLHEWFPEVPELEGARVKKNIWRFIERFSFRVANIIVTVNDSLSEIYYKNYGRKPIVVRNIPLLRRKVRVNGRKKNFENRIIYYQGAVNTGRGLEAAIEAMKWLPNWKLWIVGDGDILDSLKNTASISTARERIIFWGRKKTDELDNLMAEATVGINLLESNSANYYYSLANKFFDYMMMGIPSINMNFPEYRRLIKKIDSGYLLEKLDARDLAKLVLSIEYDEYESKVDNCVRASKVYNWEIESEKLKMAVNSYLKT